jgi:type I restriction enzyme S subunit
LTIKWRIPPTWASTLTGEIAEIVGGGTPSTLSPENFERGEIPWITPADLPKQMGKNISRGRRSITDIGLQDSSARLVPKGAVLFSARAPIGYVAIAATGLTTNQGIKSFIPLAGIDSDYLYYSLLRTRNIARSLSSGTTFPEISATNCKLIPVALAPFNEQSRIVSALDKQFGRLDFVVAALVFIKSRLRVYRASLLKAACQGELVATESRRASGRRGAYESGSELLERILVERRAKWEAERIAQMRAEGKEPKDDKWKTKYIDPEEPQIGLLPSLPEGWVWATIQQLSTKVVDGVHKKPDYVGIGIPFITVRNLTAGNSISFERVNYVSDEDHDRFIKRANPQKGDLLISKDGTLGVVRLVRTKQPFSIFVSVALIKPVLRTMSSFLEVALSSPQVQMQMTPKGSGLQHIHLEDLRLDCVPIPPLAEQRRIVNESVKRLQGVDKIEEIIESTLERAENLRRSILVRAFEGRLVPQNPKDEPASVLLQRIVMEREKLKDQTMKQNTLRRTKKIAVKDTQPASEVAPPKKDPFSVFKGRDKWLTAEQIFQRAGYRFSADREVASFFEAIEKELETKRLVYERLGNEFRLRRAIQ